MKFSKIGLLTSIVGAMVLAGCNSGQPLSTFVEVGFDGYRGASGPTSQVSLSFKTKIKQSLNATFDVYVGARKGFANDWENDLWGCNPGYGAFAIYRVIEDEAGNEIQDDYIILDDFPNDEKYPLTYETIEGTCDGVIMHYEGFVTDTFDFSRIDAIKGRIVYFICYYGDINQKEFAGNCYLYGISWGGKLNFEKNDDTVTFSKWI